MRRKRAVFLFAAGATPEWENLRSLSAGQLNQIEHIITNGQGK